MVLILGLSGIWISAPRVRAAAGVDEQQVAQAIAKGVQFLLDQQEPQGNWSYTFNQDHTLGITALAGLALLENGLDRGHQAIAKASEVVRTLAPRSDQTYDLALAILFLARSQPGSQGPNDPLIRRLAQRLAAGEQGGMWTYTVPPAGDEEAVGSRRGGRAFRRPRMPGLGDNSNTQFALLGIWAASRHAFDANAALEAIDEHFRSTQNDDGRWGYVPNAGGGEAMTCAGLMGLAIAAARPSLAERQSARARGAALAGDPVFVKALAAVARDAREISARSDIYYIWSLERVCVALGLRKLDGLDWYAAGAGELLRRQQDDGAWPNDRWGPLPNTCLALLFLRKANLAFELDRVLKLPAEPRDEPPAQHAAQPEPAPQTDPGSPVQGDSDVKVIVRGTPEVKFPEIGVQFEVQRPDGSFLLDAGRADFRVLEEGQEVPILSFQGPLTTEALPITVVLVVDRSQSMEEEDRIGGLKRAVATFVQGLPQGSRVAVVAFGSEVQTICPFTTDPQQVRNAVEALTPAGATRYYDAVAEALAMLERESGRRAVLALTDGEDTFSQSATIDSDIAAARRLGLPVHTLGLGTEDEIESGDLRRLAAETRGQYYPARQADQLRTIYQQLAQRLSSSYSLVYRTDRRLPDGTLRPVQVFYRASRAAGETAVFIPGMIVPAAGWPRLFLLLVAALATLAALPGWLARRAVRAP
jgi:VWFA-related protein